jgi:hypothetical protein
LQVQSPEFKLQFHQKKKKKKRLKQGLPMYLVRVQWRLFHLLCHTGMQLRGPSPEAQPWRLPNFGLSASEIVSYINLFSF